MLKAENIVDFHSGNAPYPPSPQKSHFIGDLALPFVMEERQPDRRLILLLWEYEF